MLPHILPLLRKLRGNIEVLLYLNFTYIQNMWYARLNMYKKIIPCLDVWKNKNISITTLQNISYLWILVHKVPALQIPTRFWCKNDSHMPIYLFMKFVFDKKFNNVRFYGTKIHQILDKEIFGLSQVNNSFFPLNRHY